MMTINQCKAIPQIIHQTWIGGPPPERLLAYSESWRAHHPHWEYRLWTDEEVGKLLDQHYPEYRPYYHQYPYIVQQVDLVRFLQLHRYGGLCVDMDMECLRPIDELLIPGKVMLAREFEGLGLRTAGQDYVCNGIMAVPPGHPLLGEILELMKKRARPKRFWELRYEYIMKSTGPGMLDAAVRETSASDLKIYPPATFFSAGTLETSEAVRREKSEQSGAYTVHHNEHSWFPLWLRVVTYAIHFLESRFGIRIKAPSF
jgi:mannosyltransferase OCH1-like enzyme